MVRLVKNAFLVGIVLLLMSVGAFAAYTDLLDTRPGLESVTVLLLGVGLLGIAEFCRKRFGNKSPK